MINNDNILFREANLKEVDCVMQIIRSCTLDMISKKIYQWNEKYPNLQTFINDINNKKLYVLELNSELIGCVSITLEMDEFYKKINWISQTDKNMYVHRLAVHPKYQGNGYAKLIMNFIEKKAITHTCMSVRLDTFSINNKNNIFYSKLGYQKLGQIYFRDQSDMPFNCYEKPLK